VRLERAQKCPVSRDSSVDLGFEKLRTTLHEC
jgi:hypothetical protein